MTTAILRVSPWVEVGEGTTNGIRWRLERSVSLIGPPTYRVVTPMAGDAVLATVMVSHLDVVIAALSAGSGCE